MQAGGYFTLDYRFFSLDKEGNGHASCGVVRTTIATLLHETCPAGDFLSPKWFSGLAKAAKNPTIRGFMVEHMTLSLMELEALPALNMPWFKRKPTLVEIFPGNIPSRPETKGLILYIPTKHQYQAVDGILVYWGKPQEDTRKKRRMAGDPDMISVMGVQITLDDNHKNREKEFLVKWNAWASQFCQEVEFHFVWIVETILPKFVPGMVEATMKGPQNARVVDCPRFKRSYITFNDVSTDIEAELARFRTP